MSIYTEWEMGWGEEGKEVTDNDQICWSGGRDWMGKEEKRKTKTKRQSK